METGNDSSDAVRDVHFYLQKTITFERKLSYSYLNFVFTIPECFLNLIKLVLSGVFDW